MFNYQQIHLNGDTAVTGPHGSASEEAFSSPSLELSKELSLPARFLLLETHSA